MAKLMPPGQNRLDTLLDIKVCKGIDNLTWDDTKLSPGYFRVVNNVDIDSEGVPHRRMGIERQLISGSFHSVWSDGLKLSFGVKDSNLVKINTDWTVTILLAGVGNSRMNFVQVFDQVFFSNSSVVGYIEDSVAHGFPNITQTFKTRMVGGHLIEYFNGRLYAAQDETILFSDPYAPMVMDTRSNAMTVGGPITMLKAVNNGLYVGVKDKVLWIGGNDPWDKTPEKVKIFLDVPVVPGSAVTYSGDIKGVLAKTVLFATPYGIYEGFPSGELMERTGGHYGVFDAEIGSAVINWHVGEYRYFLMTQNLIEDNDVDMGFLDPGSLASMFARESTTLSITDTMSAISMAQ